VGYHRIETKKAELKDHVSGRVLGWFLIFSPSPKKRIDTPYTNKRGLSLFLFALVVDFLFVCINNWLDLRDLGGTCNSCCAANGSALAVMLMWRVASIHTNLPICAAAQIPWAPVSV
jgi:hypothetical protein